MAEKKKVLLVIDANSLIHRAFHALPPLSTPKGEMVNAVYGFFMVFFKVLKEFQPDYVAAAFDAPGPTKREKTFAEYKAKRVKAADELYAQIPLIKEALKKLGVPTYEQQGFEADDYIGTVVKLAHRRQVKPRVEVVIVSGDQDAFQLIDEETKVYTMRKGMQDTVLYDQKAVEKKFGGLRPEQIIDYKALRGDPSDNIPGVTGIGEKTAIELLSEFGSVENLYSAIKNGNEKGKIKPRILQLLRDYKDQALLSQQLATIEQAAPINFRLPDLSWQADFQKIKKALEHFGLRTLLARLEQEYAGNAQKNQRLLLDGEKQQKDSATQMREKIERFYQDQVLSQNVYDLEKKLVPVLVSMEERGIKIDKAYFGKLEKEFARELKTLEKKIFQLATQEFNINSPKQLAEILFDVLGISPAGFKKTPGGAISTAAGELEKLQDKHPIGKELLLYRELQKLYTTYIKPLPLMADGNDRLHTHFDPLGAATGRLSSSNPNLQNIPVQGDWGKRIRQGFIPERGTTFFGFDYSQMELRLAAHFSNDSKMQEAFAQGEDIHRATAAEVFGVAPEKITSQMRFRAKALNFGILYGMGPRGFAKSAKISYEDAEQFIDQYFIRFPRIKNYIEESIASAREQGYAETLYGRRRYIPEINSSTPYLRAAAERIAVNLPIQGTAADIIKMAMVEISEKVMEKTPDMFMILQIHDELLFEGNAAVLEKNALQIKDSMEKVVSLNVPLVVEQKRGKNWGELK